MNLELIFIHHKFLFYIIYLILAIVEGPIVDFTLGYFSNTLPFNLIIIYIIAFLGDFIGDLLVYSLGRYFDNVNWIHKRIKKINIKQNKNLFLTILFLKITPPITFTGLLYLGYKKTNFKEFISNVILLNIIFSILYVSLGKFSGITIQRFDSLYSKYMFLLLKVIIIFGFIYLIFRYESKLRKFLMKKK